MYTNIDILIYTNIDILIIDGQRFCYIVFTKGQVSEFLQN